MTEESAVSAREMMAQAEETIPESESLADAELMRMETENRIRNLVWTVSGDYNLEIDPDAALYQRSPSRGLYHAVCEGAFFRRYDRREFSGYLIRKLACGADSAALGRIVRLCMDASIWEWISEERKGILDLRRKAAEDFVRTEVNPDFGAAADITQYRSDPRATAEEEPFESDSGIPAEEEQPGEGLHILESMWYARSAGEAISPDPGTADRMMWLDNLGEDARFNPGRSPIHVIEMTDHLYNALVDPSFEREHGDLEAVLAMTAEDLAESEFDWQDFLAEEAEDDLEELPGSDVQTAGQSEGEKKRRGHRVVQLDEETRSKAYTYMELNYGRSYMSATEQKKRNLTLCRGVHENCSLFYTDGILHNMVRKNYQSEYVHRQYEYNRTAFRRCRSVAVRNIRQLAYMMSQAMIRRNEIDEIRSGYGNIQPRELWKVGRTGDDRLFRRQIRQENTDFVVDILMDASGSQGDRRADVAVQGYIISEALSIAGIPHRVQSFCTCWDYTILQRFREYDDPREMNSRILEYSTSASNRDGLAIRAVVHDLQERSEANKILIVLSDGRPNDRIVNRSVSRVPATYVGDFAVFDTAEEVRRARHKGIAVLGVFAGKEIDLEAEKRIFGRDFAYIRNIRNFSPVVGRYLRRQIDRL